MANTYQQGTELILIQSCPSLLKILNYNTLGVNVVIKSFPADTPSKAITCLSSPDTPQKLYGLNLYTLINGLHITIHDCCDLDLPDGFPKGQQRFVP